MNLIVKNVLAFSWIILASCNSSSTESTALTDSTDTNGNQVPPTEIKIKEEPVTYKDDTVTLKGFITYNENDKVKRPAVLVVPEWWGLGDYERTRARQLAELGYIAMAVDIYGNGRKADNPKDAQSFAMAFYQNPVSTKTRIDAALSA